MFPSLRMLRDGVDLPEVKKRPNQQNPGGGETVRPCGQMRRKGGFAYVHGTNTPKLISRRKGIAWGRRWSNLMG